MKRHCILFALFCCLLAAPISLSAHRLAPVVMMEETELPWSTVTAVLHEVDARTSYTYSELIDWYQVSLVTIEQIGTSSYKVTVYDGDGLGDVVMIENL
jgi:hypothetical protein